MSFIITVTYKESADSFDRSFRVEKEAIEAIADLINFEDAELEPMCNYGCVKHIASITMVNTDKQEFIEIL